MKLDEAKERKSGLVQRALHVLELRTKRVAALVLNCKSESKEGLGAK